MEDRSQQVLAVAILFFILSWLTVLLRIYVRAGMLKSFGLDDWLMVITQLIFTAYLVCQLGGVAHGTGRHLWDLTQENAEKALEYWFFCELFYVISACLLKVSIGLFLLRIAVKTPHVWILRLFMVGTVIFGMFYGFVVLFQCKPVDAWWTLERHGCMDPIIIVNATYAASALNAVADWTFGTLPIFIVWGLNMNKRTKKIAVGVLSFAAIGSTATVIRIPYVHALADVNDFLWATTDIAIWSTVEVGVGIAAGCAATLRPLLRHLLSKAGFSSYPHSSNRLWSQSNRQRAGYQRSIGLEDMRPDVMAGTTTAVADGKSWRGGESDEEIIVNKSVMVTYTRKETESGRDYITRMSDNS
ncbi:hypothetical protein VTN00DRAFT_2962 [Thermoascus crustaceus]|uniref:uncharacterized protein n=1 Tax=Thermoascus crustaceus TaxID=5088 RepID=UPI0037448A52